MGNDDSDSVGNDDDELLSLIVDEFLEADTWRGTATKLCEALNKIDSSANANPSTITKRLKNNAALRKDKFNISVNSDRKRDVRSLIITRESVTEQE